MAKQLLISVADLEKKKQFTAWVGNEEVLVVLTSQGVRVYSGMCPHQGGPLGDGSFIGDQVTCPWHGCQFELTQGGCTDIGACRNVSNMKLKPLAFTLDSGNIYIEVPA
jgi:nitrite reductase/ring-hydroxylating ferredoxin subunit